MKKPDLIHILAGPVRSGKTTQLQRWLESGVSAAGILTPDAEGVRMLYDIGRKQYHRFEVSETYGGEKVTIGRFCFARQAFDRGKAILERPYPATAAWLVIDEVGKLEIAQGEGWEPMVLRSIAACREGRLGCRLLLVVRDSLLGQALRKYDLETSAVITTQFPL
ncbi:nucleoside-triphosphatase [Taibaiella helva]|uniref:nucleoside-triphosphatase n=1 Tax=Taibaiella helva TaxID=2301235 RepID=UPI000E58A03F|nr:nucleoside-triphosphatase [Taibaiella helva]